VEPSLRPPTTTPTQSPPTKSHWLPIKVATRAAAFDPANDKPQPAETPKRKATQNANQIPQYRFATKHCAAQSKARPNKYTPTMPRSTHVPSGPVPTNTKAWPAKRQSQSPEH